MKLKSTLIYLFYQTCRAINRLEIVNQKVDITTYLLVMGITLPLSASLYCRVLFENLNSDYFSCCYSAEDAIYILYEKGTILWYAILFIATLLILLPLIKKSKFFTGFFIAVLMTSAIFLLVKVGGFDDRKIYLYMILLIITNLLIIYNNRNFVYAYALLIGFYFIMAANSDYNRILESKNHITLRLKNGHEILKKDDETIIWATSTSRFILIYNKTTKQLIPIERDSIQYDSLK